MAQRCSATAKSTGEQCARYAIEGGTTCRVHGSGTKRAKLAAARRTEEAKAEQQLRHALAQAYGDNVPDIDPGEAMLRAVSWKHAEVVALRAKVAELDEDEMVWGVTRVKEGGEDRGTTEEAKPNIWWQMLRAAEDALVKFAAAARAAGCDERRVQLAVDQGALVSGVLKRILAAMFDVIVSTLRANGVGDEQIVAALQRAWSDAVGTVVPRELRALGGAA